MYALPSPISPPTPSRKSLASPRRPLTRSLKRTHSATEEKLYPCLEFRRKKPFLARASSSITSDEDDSAHMRPLTLSQVQGSLRVGVRGWSEDEEVSWHAQNGASIAWSPSREEWEIELHARQRLKALLPVARAKSTTPSPLTLSAANFCARTPPPVTKKTKYSTSAAYSKDTPHTKPTSPTSRPLTRSQKRILEAKAQAVKPKPKPKGPFHHLPYSSLVLDPKIAKHFVSDELRLLEVVVGGMIEDEMIRVEQWLQSIPELQVEEVKDELPRSTEEGLAVMDTTIQNISEAIQITSIQKEGDDMRPSLSENTNTPSERNKQHVQDERPDPLPKITLSVYDVLQPDLISPVSTHEDVCSPSSPARALLSSPVTLTSSQVSATENVFMLQFQSLHRKNTIHLQKLHEIQRQLGKAQVHRDVMWYTMRERALGELKREVGRREALDAQTTAKCDGDSEVMTSTKASAEASTAKS